MRYKKCNNGEILIFRNKRKLLKRVKEAWKNEDGCIACTLFDVCLKWGGGERSVCEKMIEAGVIVGDLFSDRFFVDVPLENNEPKSRINKK